MSWFFPKGAKASKVDKIMKSVNEFHRQECKLCPLNNENVITPKMKPSGPKDPYVYILGEAPGAEEDKLGEPFIGKSGQLLRKTLGENWINDIRFNNCVRTRPPKNRTPTFQEIECCRPSVQKDIEESKPKLIIGLGKIPLNWVLNEDDLKKWRGRIVPVQIGGHVCWFLPLYHPAFLLRGRKKTKRGKIIKGMQERIWEIDIKKALAEVEIMPEAKIEDLSDVYSGVKFVTGSEPEDLSRIKRNLERLSQYKNLALDIETTSKEKSSHVFRRIRPYGKGAKIITVAIGTGDDVFAFPIHHSKSFWKPDQIKEVEKIFVSFLSNYEGRLIAHNSIFENEWIGYFYGKKVLSITRWDDTMSQAYVLDERQGMLSLDAICKARLGFELKAISNLDRNNLDNYSVESVLKYNALDSKFEYKIFFHQLTELANKGLNKTYHEQAMRNKTLAFTMLEGIDVDQSEVGRHAKSLEKQIEVILEDIMSLPVVHDYCKKYRTFNPGSNTNDLIKIFRDFIKFEGGYDEDGKYSTDKEVLQKCDHPLAELIIEWRRLSKLKSTYVDVLDIKENRYVWPDGKMHPVLKPMFTRTRRLSSEDPNEQNWPKHGNKEIRSQIVASPGCTLISCDYGQMEARVIAMASKDKKFCKAVKERYDVHAEWAERIAHAYPDWIGGKKYLKDKDVMKKARQKAKNNFVFASFYGAGAVKVAAQTGLPIEIAEKLLRDFWKEFAGIKGWQQEQNDFYEEHGYVELLTGFRRHGPMGYNEIINTPIQGTASDILIDAMNIISNKAQSTGNWGLQPRLNIHDDLTFCLLNKTIDDDLEFIVDTMLTPRYSFITLPLLVEVEYGKNWYEMKTFGEFYSDD